MLGVAHIEFQKSFLKVVWFS